MRVLVWLAEALGIRGTARVCEIDPHTVLPWLAETAEQLKTLAAYCLHDVHLDQVQLDELYAVLSAVSDGSASAAEGIVNLTRNTCT